MHRAGDGQGSKRRGRRGRVNFNGKTAFAMENTFMFVSLCSYEKTLQKMKMVEREGEGEADVRRAEDVFETSPATQHGLQLYLPDPLGAATT